jgi:hypothetical protein
LCGFCGFFWGVSIMAKAQVSDQTFIEVYKSSVKRGVSLSDIALGFAMSIQAVSQRVRKLNETIAEVNAKREAEKLPLLAPLHVFSGGKRGRKPLSERVEALADVIGTVAELQPTE